MARLRTDWILFLTIVAMVFFGMVMLYSASSAVAELRYHVAPYYFVVRQIGWAAVSFLALHDSQHAQALAHAHAFAWTDSQPSKPKAQPAALTAAPWQQPVSCWPAAHMARSCCQAATLSRHAFMCHDWAGHSAGRCCGNGKVSGG